MIALHTECVTVRRVFPGGPGNMELDSSMPFGGTAFRRRQLSMPSGYSSVPRLYHWFNLEVL